VQVREVIVADCVRDLPTDVKKKVLNLGVDEGTLDMHFDVLCTVMHFKLKHVFKTKVEAAKLEEKRELRKERRKELLAAAAEVKTAGRRPTRARTLTVADSRPFRVPIQPKLLQWLDELQGEAENLMKESDSDDEDGDAKEKEGAAAEEPEKAAPNRRNPGGAAPAAAAATRGGKEKVRRDEIVEEGQKLPCVGDPQAMSRKYKGWDQSGRGGFGTVYMTKDTGGKQLVAVKVMPHKSVKEQQTNFAEVYFLNKLRHPNIVTYYNSFVLPEEIWVAMEFLQGGTLSDACKARQFQEDEVAFTARELLQGVKYMHDHGLAHRDM
jgi:hypothetical protein